MLATTRLSIIIPCYNEKENLTRGVLDQIAQYLRTVKYSWEVIISDDGSTDGSLKLLENFVKSHRGFRLIKNPHGGKAKAISTGVLASKGKVILFTDMDQSTPLKEVSKLLPWYDRGYDVVFGSRGKMRHNFPWYRQVMSWGFRSFRQLFLLHQVADTQCGFKSFRSTAAKEVFPLLEAVNSKKTARGWSVSAFDVELLFLAQKRGYKLKEVNVSWSDTDTATGKSKNFVKESLDMLKQILRVKLNDLNGYYV